MKRFLALLVAGGLVAAAFGVRHILFADTKGSAREAGAVTVPVVCASEIQEYCAASFKAFQASRPDVEGRPVRVRATYLDSAAAEDEIVNQRIKPLAWIPASTAWVDRANVQYRARNGVDVFLKSGEYQMLPVALSPTVWVIWADRAAVLLKDCTDTITWQCIERAAANPGGWRALGGNPEWGLVKFGHANPVTTNSGLLALILMSYGYYNRNTGLTPADVTEAGYQQFVLAIERSVPSFSPTSGDFARDLIIYGPRYDIASTYEFVAATQVDNAKGRGGTLAVFYPPVNAWSDFPFAVLVTKDSGAIEKDAAVKLRDFMFAKANQRRALALGLRPANPDVPVVNSGDNPLTQHTADGIQLTIARNDIADFPSIETVTALQQFWEQEVRR